MKTALVLNAVNPGIGGVLIRGERGTAKSTAVRALAGLLPEIEAVAGCRFSCSPGSGDLLCDECRARQLAGEHLLRLSRPMRVVELPINATEDRVVGTIDIERAIKGGERSFEPGILAEANRNILYVDEVNLLDDHLVDVLLDAAAMGVNIVEREGISVVHPSRFILVGTMNPEEGELRPQLLDRFGLCVDVVGLRSVDDRVAVMERDIAQQTDPVTQRGSSQEEEERTTRDHRQGPGAAAAGRGRRRDALADRPGVHRRRGARPSRRHRGQPRRPDPLRPARGRGGGRASAPAPRPVAPPTESLYVTVADITAATELALRHRRRERPGERGGNPSVAAEQQRERMQELAEQAREEAAAADGRARGARPVELRGGGPGRAARAWPTGAVIEAAGQEATRLAASTSSSRASCSRCGRSSCPATANRASPPASAPAPSRGTSVGVTSGRCRPSAPPTWPSTRPCARPLPTSRGGVPRARPVGRLCRLERQDLRQKVRRRRTGTLIVFVVDASASMDAEQRMQATKGAVLSLLRDAYVRRDKVALVVFSGRTARVALSPTSSVDLAEARLQRLTVGGTTPLTHGLVAGLKLVRTERLRDANVYPLIVLISDGRGNISLFGEEPLVEAQRIAEQIGNEHIRTLVIDSSAGHRRCAASGRRRAGAPGRCSEASASTPAWTSPSAVAASTWASTTSPRAPSSPGSRRACVAAEHDHGIPLTARERRCR